MSMVARHHFQVVRKRKECAVCGGRKLETALDLPNLPLTGMYSKSPMKGTVKGVDQHLLICLQCGHAQISDQIDPGLVYGEAYSFRTSESATARRGTDFFMSVLDEVAPAKRFQCVVDLGCNDLHLLKRLRRHARIRVGIDPMWASKEDQRNDRSIVVIGSAVEEIDLHSILESPPDLIVCRHTLEHIYDPRKVLQHLMDVAPEGALLLFEMPGFEPLVERLRFDQVFHQHLQYFSLSSLTRLFEEFGGRYIAHRQNYHDWGAMVVAFRKGKGNGRRRKRMAPTMDIADIRRRYGTFRRQTSATNDALNSLKDSALYGYGAAQMLPVLAYHMGNDLSMLKAVLDDDPTKNGLYYWNLPLVIRQSSDIADWESASVFITAVDNVQPILHALWKRRPKHILYPFHIMYLGY